MQLTSSHQQKESLTPLEISDLQLEKLREEYVYPQLGKKTIWEVIALMLLETAAVIMVISIIQTAAVLMAGIGLFNGVVYLWNRYVVRED